LQDNKAMLVSGAETKSIPCGNSILSGGFFIALKRKAVGQES
jgi:hypothetical protein